MRKKFFKRPLAYMLVLAMVLGTIPAFSALAVDDGVTYEDGTYIQTITVEPDEDEDFETYQTDITVTIEDGMITSIVYTDEDTLSDDNYTYADRAMNGYTRKGYTGVADQIIESQSTEDIDTVTSATCSSIAIIEGVSEVLEEADIAETVTTTEETTTAAETTTEAETTTAAETTTEAETTTAAETTTEAETEEDNTTEAETEEDTTEAETEEDNTEAETEEESTEAETEEESAETETEEGSEEDSIDGEYVLTITVVPDEDEDFESYQTEITVTIEDGLIVSIVYTDDSTIEDDNYDYADRAMNGYERKGYVGVAEQIIASQSADDIDVVSTATCSSNAIIEAVKELLDSLETSSDETDTGENEEETEETEETEESEESDEDETEVDTASLEALIDALSLLTESDYTEETWEALQEALSVAEALLASDEELTQDDVDAVLADLSAAVVALEDAEDENDSSNSDSSDSESSDSTSSDSTSSDSTSSDSTSSDSESSDSESSDSESSDSDSSDSDSSDSDSSDSTTTDSTETGDSTNTGFYMALMMSALCAIGLCVFVLTKTDEEN